MPKLSQQQDETICIIYSGRSSAKKHAWHHGSILKPLKGLLDVVPPVLDPRLSLAPVSTATTPYPRQTATFRQLKPTLLSTGMAYIALYQITDVFAHDR